MSRADVFRLLDDENNRGNLITAVHGERVDFMDSLDSNDDAEDDINDEFAYGKQLMAPWKLYCPYIRVVSCSHIFFDGSAWTT